MEQTEKPEKFKVVFAGGGTGGHVYPNIAIYEAIKDRYPESSFLYIGTKKGAESRVVKNIPQPIPFIEVPSKAIPQKIKSFTTLFSLFYILLGTIKSFFILKRFKPDIIIGSGGYVSAPVLFAASLLKLKVFIHEQNAVPGRMNRSIARFANRIGVSFASTANFFPADKVVVTGYPLRKAIRYSKDDNIKKKYKIPQKNKVVFIFGGSGGARTINNAVAEIIPMLLAIEDLTVILSTGRGYSREYKAFDDTIKIFQDIGIPSEIEGKLIIREYFDNIDEIYSITDLVVSRAGAGTIKEITTMGLPSILIPKIDLPGDHQILNAREIEKLGGARIVYETVLYRNNKQTIYVPEMDLFKTIRETMFDSDALFNMRKNLKQVEKQNSTELILKEIELLVKGKVKPAENQIKIYYLHSHRDEKNIELIFDSTTLGNSLVCDIFLEGDETGKLFIFQIKTFKDKNMADERIMLRRIKGDLKVDGQPVEKWVELKEDSQLEVNGGGRIFTLKSYFEKVEKVYTGKSTTSKVVGSSFGIMISRLGGFFREIFVAAYFGAGKITDIFMVGLTIVNLLRRIVAENALENAFLPIFSRIFHRTSRKKTWEAASSIVNFTVLFSLVLTGVLIILAPYIIKAFFPGFVIKGIAGEATALTRLIVPYLFFVTIASVMTTYLKAFDRFGIAESSAIFFSIGTILGILLFYSKTSPTGYYALGYGIMLGGIMQILFLLPFNYKVFKNKSLQFTYKPVLNLNSPFNRKYYSQLAPISVDVILTKVSEVVGKILASYLRQGALSFLHFSLNLFQLPFAIISQAINTVLLKEYSEQIALFDKNKARQLYVDGIKTNMFFLVPISVLMIALAEPLVSLLLGYGSFSANNVTDTAWALKYYSIGLVGWGIHSLTVRIFSARLDIKTSVVLNFFMLLVSVGLSLWLVKTKLTFAGLALATSISFLLFAFIRVLVLKVKLEREDISIKHMGVLSSIAKTLIATIIMLIVVAESKFIFQTLEFKSRFLGNLFLLSSLSFIGIAIFFLTSLLLKNTEMLIFKRKPRNKIPEMPVSMLSPFQFIEKVSRDSEAYKDDFFYKINIYTSSEAWEVRNIGIKLIGLFKDTGKVNYLTNLLKSKKENGFMRRNALQSLTQLNAWNQEIKALMPDLLKDSYYEVRAAALAHLAKCAAVTDYQEYRELLHQRLKRNKFSLDEQLAWFKVVAKLGGKEELPALERFFLTSNSLVREELLETLYSFYRRKLLSEAELKEQVGKILITSNHLNPEFKLKSIIKKIYKEIE